MARTFSVSDVDPSRDLHPRISMHEAVQQAISSMHDGEPAQSHDPALHIEACSAVPGGVIAPGSHPMLTAVQLAFDRHHPLVLSPDQVWLLLAQGFALHVNQHADALRGQFVAHSGQLELEVRRDHFVLGRPDNPWTEVFEAFSTQIKTHIGKRHQLVVCDFSTTGPLERAVSDLVMLDTVKRWFSYSFVSLCGIPKITLLGTPEDWHSIQRRARVFGEYGLERWARALDPILGAFVDAAEGRVDADHWRSLYKMYSSSGGPFITGWIQVLFPYVIDGAGFRPNPNLDDWSIPAHNTLIDGIQSGDLPCGMHATPFTWHYLLQALEMTFLAGFVGVRQDQQTGAVQPQLGWAVASTTPRQPQHDDPFALL